MWNKKEGSTSQLLQFCFGYFFFYVVTGLTVKYFLGSPDRGLPGMSGLEFLFFSNLGGTSLCLSVVLIRKWFLRLESVSSFYFLGKRLPAELLFIIPSGVCTAVIIPATTLMYTLPISVMVAMVIMRGSVIVISRLVDAIQIRQGLLKKKVHWEVNVAVILAMGAVGIHLTETSEGGFDFLGNVPAMVILISYITAYAIRIYIMNFYKNTRLSKKSEKKAVPDQNNKAFFGIEQISATSIIFVVSIFVIFSPDLFGWSFAQVLDYRKAVFDPHPSWNGALFSGFAFGFAAFFSVFLFMFKGRTASFAGLVNRLTSLLAGVTATVLFHYLFGGRWPSYHDWMSLVFILGAVGFLTKAEKRLKEG